MENHGKVVKTTSVELPAMGFLESVKDSSGKQAGPPAKSLIKPSVDNSVAEKWRPLHRPPMAVLYVLDDVGRGGEFIRLKSESFIIGREEGDHLIPHDNGVSTQHVEIQRVIQADEFRWYAKDLDSTNGTYVKIDEAELKHNQEIYFGSRRYRFEAASLGKTSAITDRAIKRKATQQWQVASVANPENFSPSLIELTQEGDGQRFLLSSTDQSIGRNAEKCSVVIENDPFVDPVQCRIVCRDDGEWHLEDSKSTNGTWARVQKVRIRDKAMFMVGEQRFVVGVM